MLCELPVYKLGGIVIDPEEVILATLLMIYLIKNGIKWNAPPKEWVSHPSVLKEKYKNNPKLMKVDEESFQNAMNKIGEFIRKSFCAPHIGWNSNLSSEIEMILSDHSKAKIQEKMNENRILKHIGITSEPGPITLGKSQARITGYEFTKWPVTLGVELKVQSNISRSEYARIVWSKIFEKISSTRIDLNGKSLELSAEGKRKSSNAIELYDFCDWEQEGQPNFKQERAFKIRAEMIDNIPTVWAQAFQYHQSIKAKQKNTIEEWFCLLVLFYFGLAYIEIISIDKIEKNLSPSFAIALTSTYPLINSKEKKLSEVRVLKMGETIIGAYYPCAFIFFPCRNRSEWKENQVFQYFYDGKQLSWEKCKRALRSCEGLVDGFINFIEEKIYGLLDENLAEVMGSFCATNFNKSLKKQKCNEEKPEDWIAFEGNENEWLKLYPLKQKRNDKGLTYFLISNSLNLSSCFSPWMVAPILNNFPVPLQFEKAGERKIRIQHRGKDVMVDLSEDDEVIEIKDLFIKENVCKIELSPDSNQFGRFHEKHQSTNDSNSSEQLSLYLLPIAESFLKFFPLNQGKFINKVSNEIGEHQVVWTFTLLDYFGKEKELNWTVSYQPNNSIKNSVLCLWPPKLDKDLFFYIAYGKTRIARAGWWNLISETQKLGEKSELGENEYICVLDERTSKQPSRPIALMLNQVNNDNGGVLLLKDISTFDPKENSLLPQPLVLWGES